MGLLLLEGPEEDAVSLEEAQRQVRSSSSLDDADLLSYVAAATHSCEAHCRRRFVTQSWRQTFDRWPDKALVLAHPPLATVESVKYIDAAGDEQTLDESVYRMRAMETPGEIVLAYGQSWPTARAELDAIRVEFTCGFGAAADVPDEIKRAILMLVGTLYANHESVSPTQLVPVPHGVELLLGPWTVRRLRVA